MIALLVAAAVAAQEPPETALVYGTGSTTCASWTEDRRRGESNTARVHAVSWLLGFVTGINASGIYGGNITEGQDTDDMAGWVDTYCASHPTETVFEAAAELVLDLNRRREARR